MNNEAMPFRDRLRLRAESGLAEATLRRRFDKGLPIRPVSEERLREAAQKLGLTLPAPQVSILRETG